VRRVLAFVRGKLDSHMQEVVRGAAAAFVLKVVGVGLAFGFSVLLARLVGAEGAGVYFLALAVTTFATIIGLMGLNIAALRFAAASASVGDWGAVKGVYRKGVMLGTASSVAAVLVMFAVAPLLAERLLSKPELTGALRWMSLAVLPMVLLILHADMLRGLKRVRDSQLIQGVSVPALSLVGLCVLGHRWGVSGAIWAYTVAAWVTALAGYCMWRVATPHLRDAAGDFETRLLLHSSVPLFWVALTNQLMNRTAIFILGIWRSSADVGIFGAAARTAMLTGYILSALNFVAAPKFAALYKQGDLESLGSTARSSARLMALLAGPILLLYILVPGKVMGLFGPQFTAGAAALVVLALGQFVNALTGPVSYLLMMSGNERTVRNIVAISAAANVLLNIYLVPRYGILGAAIATAVSLAAQNVATAYIAQRILGINVLAGRVSALRRTRS